MCWCELVYLIFWWQLKIDFDKGRVKNPEEFLTVWDAAPVKRQGEDTPKRKGNQVLRDNLSTSILPKVSFPFAILSSPFLHQWIIFKDSFWVEPCQNFLGKYNFVPDNRKEYWTWSQKTSFCQTLTGHVQRQSYLEANDAWVSRYLTCTCPFQGPGRDSSNLFPWSCI